MSTNLLFTPHLTSPVGNETFNFGILNIQWLVFDPPSEDDSITSDSVFYELQYTDNYLGHNTAWVTINSRIRYSDTSYEWKIGKQIKSSKVRIRIRAHSVINESFSEWSMSSADFTINIFKLLPPAIVNPIEGKVYFDFIQIILDETLTNNTYNQKVLYTLEYFSEKTSTNWSVIASNLPSGSTLIRWDISSLAPSDDYILKLTAQGFTNYRSEPDQIGINYVYNISIQQPGTFIIDTVPPETILRIKNSTDITKDLDQIVTVYSEDATTEVEEIQLHECDAVGNILLGQQQSSTPDSTDQCFSLDELIGTTGPIEGVEIGKPVTYSVSKFWHFKNKSGLRKIEALVKDSGGNSSLQTPIKVFIDLFNTNITINDCVINVEQISKTVPVPPSTPGGPLTFTTTSFFAELLYFITNDGGFYVLEPFSRYIFTIPNNEIPIKINSYKNQIYIFTYNPISGDEDTASVYRNEANEATLIYSFPDNSNSRTNDTCEFNENLYIGLENGKLYKYNGSSFSLLYTFDLGISSLSSDHGLLYVGFTNSTYLYVYNGSDFTTVNL